MTSTTSPLVSAAIPSPAQTLTSTLDIVRNSAPAPKDLLLLFPRMMFRLGSFVSRMKPENSTFGGTIAASAVSQAPVLPAAAAAAAAAAAEGVTTVQGRHFSVGFNFENLKALGGMVTYMTSKWALACLALVSPTPSARLKYTTHKAISKILKAIILNRTHIYASGRRHTNLNLSMRMALRALPVLMFLHHALSFLEALHCQTSPDYSYIKYGKPNQQLGLEYGGSGGLLYRLTSRLLFWQDDVGSCAAVGMINSSPENQVSGSLSLLWPLFRSLCFSQFIETLSCVVQGRPTATETGMSVIEHSLAFAEVEAMIKNQLETGPYPLHTTDQDNKRPATDISTIWNALSPKLNTPPEVLLIGLISSLNSLSSHVLGVMNLQSRFRLINTGLWGLCYMASFLWGIDAAATSHFAVETAVLRFPTVCIVSLIPHILILTGASICALIYGLALCLFVVSPPPGLAPASTLTERFSAAHENLQANAKLRGMRLNWSEDFYTALLRLGFAVLTVATEAVYLNEGRTIRVIRSTLLEDERAREIEILAQPIRIKSGANHDKSTPLGNEAHLEDVRESGYAKEMSTKALKAGMTTNNSNTKDGVGAIQRIRRYQMAIDFFRGIFWLQVRWFTVIFAKLLGRAGISWRPKWMTKSVRVKDTPVPISKPSAKNQKSLDFWLLSDDGVLSLPKNNLVDVEAETKKRMRLVSDEWGEGEEELLDSTLYGWWTHGGWWGEKDESGTYSASVRDDDTTSVVSESATIHEGGWDSCDTESGPRTPTQDQPHPGSRSPTRGSTSS